MTAAAAASPRSLARDLEDYGAFVRDVLRALPGVTSVESVLSLREVKRNAGLPLL